MIEDHEAYDVGAIGNYYGCLELKRENGTDYWTIENWSGRTWQAIPSALADAIRVAFPPPQGDDQ